MAGAYEELANPFGGVGVYLPARGGFIPARKEPSVALTPGVGIAQVGRGYLGVSRPVQGKALREGSEREA